MWLPARSERRMAPHGAPPGATETIMGIDFHALNFLRYAKSKKGFGDTLTIGRQELHVNAVKLRGVLKLAPDYKQHAYCEELLLGYFGSTSVDSIDNSSYENATYIHDMNAPLPETLFGKYDTIIDAGTTEHVYNAPQALKNYSLMCKPGGRIIHILPANNFSGHGFWQFSPELFFSLYSDKNGYRDTEVFVSDFTDQWQWYQIQAPKDGKRVDILSAAELSVMVVTTLARPDFSHASVQQSDYVYEWENQTADPKPLLGPTGLKGRLMETPILYKTLYRAYHKLIRLRSPRQLGKRNPGLRAIDVDSFLR
jgi:hypothetical protein